MKYLLISCALVWIACAKQKNDNIEIIGEWIEVSHVQYDRQEWMVPDAFPNEHYFFMVNSRFEDHTYATDIQTFPYRLVGKDLTIGERKYKIDSLSQDSFILYTYKDIIDIQNDNPYSRKYYFKRVKK